MRPLGADRRLGTGHQALVLVHPLIGDGGDLGRVPHKSGDELRGEVTEAVGVLSDEGVLLVAPQGEVGVHTGTLHVRQRLGHETRGDAGLTREFFHDVAQPGDAIELRGPLGGHFVWRPADGGPLLLIAGGSGIVPLMAMVRDWAAMPAATASPALLVCSARTWEDIVCPDEWTALQAARPDFGFIAATTRGSPHRETDITRRLDDALLRDILTGWGHTPRHAYVCGSNAFVESATGGLTAAGIRAEIIRTERYGG